MYVNGPIKQHCTGKPGKCSYHHEQVSEMFESQQLWNENNIDVAIVSKSAAVVK